ncbi:MAG TPA: hypothetical protein DD653_09585 [Marinilabiliales bacterium]|nr:hypothetical protein [Marinilabiliales bacterium]
MPKNDFANHHLILISFLFTVFSFLSLKAQETKVDSLSVENEEQEDFSYFIVDEGYTNNNLSNSQLKDSAVATLLTDVSFCHKSGLFVSLMPSYYMNASTRSYDLDASLGFLKSFGFGLDVSAQYTYHYYNGDTLLRGIQYQHAVGASVSYSVKGLTVGVDGNALLGISNNYFVTPSLGYYLGFDDLVFEDDYFTFFPNMSATFSTDYWLYDNLGPWKQRILERYLTERLGFPTKTMSLQSFDFMVPLSYSVGNFTISASYMYSIPSDKYKKLTWDEQSSVLVSLSYMINL